MPAAIYNIKKILIMILMVIGLPLTGLIITGAGITQYLEFPPKTQYINHASFSIHGFIILLVFILIILSPFLFRLYRYISSSEKKTVGVHKFPWWGYASILAGIITWGMAWTRFDWFHLFQGHTYTPLWLSYIISINAMTFKRRGKCMMLSSPLYFFLLFPVSSVFWWIFEYLNRFVQNWYYLETLKYSPVEYFIFASLAFSTVLPAVLGTRDYLLTFPVFSKAFGNFFKTDFFKKKSTGVISLIVFSAGLAGIGIFPNALFPLLWVSPLVILASLQIISGENSIFTGIDRGDWSFFVVCCASALICGFFWEMWNYYSLAKWIYIIPYFQAVHVFEMPALGYSGYLPFGLECAVIGDILDKTR